MAHEAAVTKLWASSYPLLSQAAGAAVTCRVIRRLVEIRAESFNTDESWFAKVHRALEAFAIPVDQWKEFNSLYSQHERADHRSATRPKLPMRKQRCYVKR
jgi:hypothetical protein